MVGAPPWPIEMHGLVIGRPLDEHTCRRLALVRETDDDELPGYATWSTADGELSVGVCDDLIGLVNLRSSARLDGTELIGASREELIRLLGQDGRPDEVIDGLSFRQGPWELFIGFKQAAQDRVAWVTLSHDEVLDES
jgi:hypothetical protein